ncbi:MAG TPA: response regulator transcription factor [Solirubrobacteraceae bacterium]|nr:response regulator transcription factor [Solirubrobacteraceae bacterium]
MSGRLHVVDGDPFRGESEGAAIRVILAEGHAGLRRNLRLLLEREPDMKVVAQATDFEGTIRELGVHHPRVLVLDLAMADGSIAERINRLRERSRRTAVVVITMHENPMLADQALRAGATGFVLKHQADLELVDAVRDAARGAQYRSPRLREIGDRPQRGQLPRR